MGKSWLLLSANPRFQALKAPYIIAKVHENGVASGLEIREGRGGAPKKHKRKKQQKCCFQRGFLSDPMAIYACQTTRVMVICSKCFAFAGDELVSVAEEVVEDAPWEVPWCWLQGGADNFRRCDVVQCWALLKGLWGLGGY